MNPTFSHFINGQWSAGKGEAFSSVNPADGTTLWQGQAASQLDVNAAYEAAHAALPQWSALTPDERAEYLLSFAKCLESKRAELTAIISQETGKPTWEAATETAAVIGKAGFTIKAFQERTSDTEVKAAGAIGHIRYKPHGVVAVIGPFNFPAHLSNGHIMPALLAGNTVVYKPSELTPGVAALITSCWEEIGLPPGVLNTIQGGLETSKALLQGDLRAVYFTGSYRVGQLINQQFADRPEVLIALEMGGNNPLVLDEVDDLDAAVYNTLQSAYITAGQRCTCARRLFVPKTQQGDEFLQRFINASEALKVGAYTEQPEPFMGPVIRHAHALDHLKAQDKLQALGGESYLSMSLLKENTGFLSPGIIDMTNANQAPDDEIFAPLVQVYRYDDFDQALTLANQTQYGLSAALLSKHAHRFTQFYQTVNAGIINWNKPTTGAGGNMPFGGIGHSGNHRPSAYFAADYCAYPVASTESSDLRLPETLSPGIHL